MLSVIKHAVNVICFSQKHSACCVQHSSAATVQNFFRSPEVNSYDYSTRVYGVIRHYEYELQVSNIEEIKQQLAELRQIINTAFARRDFRLSVFPQVEQRH